MAGRLAAALGATLVAVAGLGAGCSAATTAAPPPPSQGSTATPTPSAGASALTIAVDDGSATTTTWRLTCDPAAGTHPDPAEACRVLAAGGQDALPPVPGDRQCTAVYGGPERATVTGSWRGQRVDSSLSRTNGCEIERWDLLDGLLPLAAT